MDIYFTNEKTGEEFQFPSLPPIDSLQFNGESLFAEYDLMDPGEVRFHRGNRLDTFSFEGTFYNAEFRGRQDYIKNEMKPLECVKKLKKWKEDGDVIKVLMTETFINDRYEIATFGAVPTIYGEFSYSIELVQKKDVIIEIVSDKKSVKTSDRDPLSKAKEKQKQIAKQNDNRFRMAKRITGLGANYNNIPKNLSPGELIKIPTLIENMGGIEEIKEVGSDIKSVYDKFRGWTKK